MSCWTCREEEWREFAGTQREKEDAGPCPCQESGAELGTELAFLMSSGLAVPLTIFIWEPLGTGILQHRSKRYTAACASLGCCC